jgi:hypothetical protein
VNERARPGLVARLAGFFERAVAVLRQIVDRIVSITIRRPPGRRCAEIPKLPEGHRPNPVQCNTVKVTAFDSSGGLMVYPNRSQPETLVRRQGAIKGFDIASRLEKSFPPSSNVEVVAAHFGQPARIEAFSAGLGSQVKMMDPASGVPQTLTFTGSSIDRVVVSQSNNAVLMELCH